MQNARAAVNFSVVGEGVSSGTALYAESGEVDVGRWTCWRRYKMAAGV
jgi:hypothetical protein